MKDITIGSVLGPARLERFLGEGNVGAVWKGRHQGLGLDVAVKTLKPDCFGGEDRHFRARFQREARLAARLNHPGIVRVLDFGEHDGIPYLIMEYVDGHTLEEYLRRQQAPVVEVTGLKILLATANALAAAHDDSVVHRDLKPANLLIDKRGRLKIADFGLARESGSAALTQDKVAVGSPYYMAPEIFQTGITPDHRIDIYALGVIGYQIAFGQLPYHGSISQVIHGHLGGNARWDLATTWSAPALALIRRLMHHDCNERPQTAHAIVAEIRRLANKEVGKPARGTGSSANRNPVAIGSGSGELLGMVRFLGGSLSSHTTQIHGRTITHTSARERLVVWAVLLTLVAVAVIGYVSFAPHRATSAQPAVAPLPHAVTTAEP